MILEVLLQKQELILIITLKNDNNNCNSVLKINCMHCIFS